MKVAWGRIFTVVRAVVEMLGRRERGFPDADTGHCSTCGRTMSAPLDGQPWTCPGCATKAERVVRVV